MPLDECARLDPERCQLNLCTDRVCFQMLWRGLFLGAPITHSSTESVHVRATALLATKQRWKRGPRTHAREPWYNEREFKVRAAAVVVADTSQESPIS